MNVFNRVMMILMILVVFFVLTIVLAVPAESLTVIKSVVDSTLHTMNRIRPEFILPFRALLILCAVLLDVLLIGLLMLEVRGPARHIFPVQRVGGGTAMVTAEALAERLRYHLDQLADVIGVKVKVTPRGSGVELDLDVQTGADVNVPEKANQVLETTRQVIEDKIGLKLARKPRVFIHAMTYPSVVARPMSSSPVALQKSSPTATRDAERVSAPPQAESSSPFQRVKGEGD